MFDWDDQNERLMLGRFPKHRAPLPPEYAAFHEQFYTAARDGKHAGAAIALKLERWMHRQVAAVPAMFPLLEIGAGTLNHIPFEVRGGTYDIVEPMQILYTGRSEVARISNTYDDISKIPEGTRYARIISIAAFEHILNLPEVVAKAALHLEKDGHLRAGIPSEGGLLWYAAYMLGTGTTFRLKYRLSYSVFQRYEHVNNAREIENVCRIFFRSIRVRRWPLPLLHGSFYSHIDASQPNIEAAARYLDLVRSSR